MYKRVVVPLDGSPLAEGMLRFIVAEAVLRQAEIPVFLMRMTEAQVGAPATGRALR